MLSVFIPSRPFPAVEESEKVSNLAYFGFCSRYWNKRGVKNLLT